MVQVQVELESLIDLQYQIQKDQYGKSTCHQQIIQERKVFDNQTNHLTPTHSSIVAWRAMLERSNKRLEKYNNVRISETTTLYSNFETPKFDEEILGASPWEDIEDEIYPNLGSSSSANFTNCPMQQENIQGSQPDQKLNISIYQESLMTTCSELIDSLTSEKSSEEISKTIKIERPECSEQDDWISGFSAAISTNTSNETHVTVKEELQPDEAAFNRNAKLSSSSYNQQQHVPLSLMPPTSSNTTNHGSGVRSNSISSISGESANETELSCTTPSPSSGPAIPTSNTLTTFNNVNQSHQVSHASTAATSSSMVVRHTTPTPASPSSNPSSITSPSAATTAAAQHSFTLTPLGPHMSSGYGAMTGTGVVGSTYFPPGCASSSSRFGNTNQQQHNFDGSFHGTWTTPFGAAGLARPNYNGIPQFMSGQNQVFPGSPFQSSMVSNAEGSSPFFTHGSGGGGLIAPPSNGNQNTDRNNRGGDSNGSSPHGVNSGSNSPHLSHGIFGHGVDENHSGGGSGNHAVGAIGATGNRKREIRLIKNREAARECRRKKKEYIKCLENRVAVLENQNKALIEELKSLKSLYNSSSTTKMPSGEGMKCNKM